MAIESPLPLLPELSPLEARVLGCLLEKEMATPEYYPLTLNSLVAACNQKSNRDPILAVGNAEVEQALEGLRQRRLASVFAGAEARVAKHKHTVDLVFPLGKVALAILAELLLRGPQTTASLRGNSERMTPMPEATEIEAILLDLASRPSGGLVTKLSRLPGQKEARWAQRLTGDALPTGQEPAAPLTVALTLPAEVERRISSLENEVAQLREELAKLKASLGES